VSLRGRGRFERQAPLGDLLPAAIDRQAVTSALDLEDLRDAGVVALFPEGGVGDRPRHDVILLAGEDQQRSALRIVRVDLDLRQRVEVGHRRLEQRLARPGDRVGVVQIAGLLL
jgi:hypothetical protein